MQQDEGGQATLRLCQIERPSSGSCGFHLSRTAWDPYPWVSGVEVGSAADLAGLQPGDCVLEVNGEDVLGQRIGQVASRVRSRDGSVTLLLWNAGSDPHAAATNISGSGPTPVSLQRLSSCLQSVLQLLECPVCLETIPPPAFQCCHGHVLCGRCRSRADKCPVCRVPLGPKGRCLLSDKLHTLLNSLFKQPHCNKPLLGTTRSNSSQRIQAPFQLKSRISTEASSPINKDILYQQPGSSAESEGTNDGSTEQPFHQNTVIASLVASSTTAETTSTGTYAEIQQRDANLNSILVQPKASSEENISFSLMAREMKPLASGEQALRTRSMSAEQIPFAMHLKKPTELEELSFHCPYQSKSNGHCRNISIGPKALLKHLRESHIGPLIQYFVKPSRPTMKLRLPLSSSRSPPSSLTSLTTDKDAVFFLQVAAGASPGQRLVWLWLLGDSTASDRYRLRLTLPEGDTHTGPVFPLTSSWNEVVNSNCCLSIEESRYSRANPEVRLEILNVDNN